MSKLKECPSCKKEVAKSAKICPGCGQKLKKSFLFKAVIGIAVVGSFFSEPSKSKTDIIAELKTTPYSQISPQGELAQMFNIMSDYTDLQRENKFKELKGDVVQWQLPVYEVKKLSEGKYRIQTLSGRGYVGTTSVVTSQSSDDIAVIENLKTGDFIQIKGIISDLGFGRNLEIEPAIIIR